MTEDVPPAVTPPQIPYSPRTRQVYWCEFWKDARHPEMWKKRPVLIISRSSQNRLSGTCLVLPISTAAQTRNDLAWELSIRLTGRPNWVLCNLPSTVATSRLSLHRGRVLAISQIEFDEIIARLRAWLPLPGA